MINIVMVMMDVRSDYVRTYGDDWDDDADADGDAVGWPLGPGWLARWTRMAGWSRLVAPEVPDGWPVGPCWFPGLHRVVWLVSPGCFGRSVRAGWLLGPGWLLLYILGFGLVGCSCLVRDPCSVHESFSCITSRRHVRIPLRSRLYPSRPYIIEMTLLPL